MKRITFALVVLFAIQVRAADTIKWVPWTDDLFTRAQKEHKLVILDLQAIWCHWCHVMEENTYSDPAVIRLINEHYIAVKVDQDARPDLSNRYEDYGWPATVVFDSKGQELVKRQGYIPPKPMATMLKACVDDPTPGPSIQAEAPVRPADAPGLSDAQRKELESRIAENFDDKEAGWGTVHKFVDADTIDYCLTINTPDTLRMARLTLDAAQNLIDPAWGGVYQYSTDGDWVHPHFEKIMSYQADDMRTYARASVVFHDPKYLTDAQNIRRFLKTFLTSPDGAFYTSMDADLIQGQHSGEFFSLDDAHRRAQGIPSIDKHIYSRENGWAISGLVGLYAASGDESALNDALLAAAWIVKNRSTADGGFKHGENDPAGPYLGDSLAMGKACLDLYEATADVSWLHRAHSAAAFIRDHFAAPAGFNTSASKLAKPQNDENVALARFANLLYHYTGDAAARKTAEAAMKYIASPDLATHHGWAVGGILLADRELNSDPLHMTIVGPKADSTARAMFLAALKFPTTYKRLEWYDPAAGPLPRADIEYPTLPKPAAFLCTNNTCSSPVYSPDALNKKLWK
jgi:uncharacterized protein